MSATWCEHEVKGYCETCEITRLEKKCAELREDAERYRGIKRMRKSVLLSIINRPLLGNMYDSHFDDEIDAAMKGE